MFCKLNPMHKSITLVLFLLAAASTNAQTQLPPNMYADTAFAPFLYGVASGDPAQDAVLLWTKVAYGTQPSAVRLDWDIATDAGFGNIVGGGTATASATNDWTVMLDATGLNPGTKYWYRFSDSLGNVSRIGRTKTAPSGTPNHLRFGVASCSSVYSGYFNAYRRLGERNALDLVIHLGDFIYDFVDPDEQVRVPVPPPVDPSNLAEWRDRYEYYLLDPDLRYARQRHPWSVIWDNHDIDADTPQQLAEAQQAFFEYIPTRLNDPARQDRIYRKLSYGGLVDLFMLDATSLRDVDVISGNEYSILGDTQWTWLSQELQNSTAQWRVLGNQRMMAHFDMGGLPSWIPFGDGPVADSSAWDGYNAARLRLLDLLAQNNIDNTVVLSGDIHMSFANDLAPGSYDPNTGAGSAAVEFIATSVTRGNFDESGFGGILAGIAQTAMYAANSHFVFNELESHGYGILDLRSGAATAEWWYSDILNQAGSESFETAYVCNDGDNHWDRNAVGPTVGLVVDLAPEALSVSAPRPNPTRDRVELDIEAAFAQNVRIEILDVHGRLLRSAAWTGAVTPGTPTHAAIDLTALQPGLYFLQTRGESEEITQKIVLTK